MENGLALMIWCNECFVKPKTNSKNVYVTKVREKKAKLRRIQRKEGQTIDRKWNLVTIAKSNEVIFLPIQPIR